MTGTGVSSFLAVLSFRRRRASKRTVLCISKEEAIEDRHVAADQRAVLIGMSGHEGTPHDTVDELAFLAETAGARVVGRVYQRRTSVQAGLFLSKGKIQDAKDLLQEHEGDLLISDEDLSPAQVRNLEKELDVKVVDRSELILDIFAQRARTRESRLQVELAQLRYILPRLAGMWAHFSRTGGGIGTRGPGETQLETDRRAVRTKIAILQKRLEEVEVERETQSRQRGGQVRLSLVGYTNAGKSTLFNQLTGAGVLAEDKLFATLDTTTRRVHLDGNLQVLLSDTVGFIRKLPHHLVASFRATLREVESADLLVHVVDASHPSHTEQIDVVNEVLDGLVKGPVPRILIFNKSDRLTEAEDAAVRHRHPGAFLMSALDREDTRRLKKHLADSIRDLRMLVRVECDAGRLNHLQTLTQRGETRTQQFVDGNVWSELWLDRADVLGLRRAGFRVEPLTSAG